MVEKNKLSLKELTEIKSWQLENIPLEVMWISEEGEILYVNEALCKQLGYAKEELNHLSIYDINPYLEPKQWKSHWQEVKDNGLVNFKTTHKKSSGKIYDAEVFAQYFSNIRNGIICALVNEITSSTFYQNVLKNTESLAKVGGWELNLQDNTILATNEALNIFELEHPEELKPINVFSYFDKPDYFQDLMEMVINYQESQESVLKIKTKSGVFKWLNCAMSPVLVQGNVKKIIGIYQDVTAYQENILSLALYKKIINSSEDIVFVYNEEGKLLHYSKSAVHQLKFDTSFLDKATIYDLDENIDPDWWYNHFNDIKKRKNFRLEWKAARKDGSLMPVDISVNHIVYENQHLNCAILRDISSRKQAEQDLQNAFNEILKLKLQLEKENEYLQEELRNEHSTLIYNSNAYGQIVNKIKQVAPTGTTVLITGESGTGKELLVNELHRHSKRNLKPLIKLNCATIPKELFESELFGHKKGSFTGAVTDKDGKFNVADGGTLFLDEIGEIPTEMQAKLLRVLQEGEFDRIGDNKTQKVDVRIIAATNRNLEEMVQKGAFREDLFYRLNVFPIHNIPLRDRKEDIEALAHHFLLKYSIKVGKLFKRVSKESIKQLLKYDFPGNIRELENIIERAIIMEEGPTLFPGEWLPIPANKTALKPSSEKFSTFEEMQKIHIINVLKHTKGKVSGINGAASILDMNHKTLHAKMKKLGIKKEEIYSD